MPTQTPLTDEINALTQYANTITGASDTCLSDAVATLADGYGGGGGGGSVVPVSTGNPLTDQMNALTAYANTVTGLQDTCLSDAVESLIAGYGGNEWDYEWNYTDGFPEDNGMTKTISGTVENYEMTDDGLYIRVNTVSYVRYDFDTVSMTTGVIEVTAIISGENNVNRPNLRIIASNGTNGGAIATPQQTIRHYNASQVGNTTVLGHYTNGVEVTIKVVLKGSTFDVYKDDTLIASDRSSSASYYATANRIFVQNVGNGYVTLKAIRAKYNRID